MSLPTAQYVADVKAALQAAPHSKTSAEADYMCDTAPAGNGFLAVYEKESVSAEDAAANMLGFVPPGSSLPPE